MNERKYYQEKKCFSVASGQVKKAIAEEVSFQFNFWCPVQPSIYITVE